MSSPVKTIAMEARSAGELRQSDRPLDNDTAAADHPVVKTISVTMPDALYQDLEDYARKKGQSAEDLVRSAVEAMRIVRQQQPQQRASVLSLKPLDLGETLRPLSNRDDLLGEMLDGHGH